MFYADFYHDADGLQEAVGDRSVVILDGRERLVGQMAAAASHGQRYGFKSFKLCRGESFTRSHSISPLIQVQDHV